MLNTDARNYASQQWNDADWHSGWGITMKFASGVSLTANTLDAGANMIPIVGGVKSVAETAVKTIVEDVAKTFTEDAVKNGTKVVADAAKTEANVTRLGITRNNPADWRATRDLWDQTGYGEILSDANRAAIAAGRTPVVDAAWISQFPEDAGLLGERIPMHHIGGGPITVPLPATRHLDAHMPGGFRYNSGGPGSALPAYPAPNP